MRIRLGTAGNGGALEKGACASEKQVAKMTATQPCPSQNTRRRRAADCIKMKHVFHCDTYKNSRRVEADAADLNSPASLGESLSTISMPLSVPCLAYDSRKYQ